MSPISRLVGERAGERVMVAVLWEGLGLGESEPSTEPGARYLVVLVVLVVPDSCPGASRTRFLHFPRDHLFRLQLDNRVECVLHVHRVFREVLLLVRHRDE
jgi:hypothetical protein